MKNNMRIFLPILVMIALAMGFLPSFTSLSAWIASSVPLLARYMGPINVLKLTAPFLIAYCWHERLRLTPRLKWLTLIVATSGTLFTLLSLSGCPSAAPILREWMVFLMGWLGALALFCLSEKNRFRVITVWTFWMYGSILIDLISPTIIDWFYNHLFDPNTRTGDFAELGHRALTGIFGRQSLAKLLAWVPWLWLFTIFQAPFDSEAKKRLSAAAWILLIATVPAILATSQRGPFVAALAALAVYGAHQAFQLKNKRSLITTSVMLVVTITLTLALVPRTIWEPRLRSLVGLHSETDTVYSIQEQTADANKNVRIRMNQFSLNVIAHHPLGKACIPEEEFRAANVIVAHAHNMFLEQFRSKGWIWGSIHLALWVMAWIFAWKLRSPAGSALVAGISSVIVSGLTDHPWFVINHALVLSSFLVLAFGLRGNNKAKSS